MMEINFLSLLCATVANIVLGSLWYSPLMFGKAWMKLAKVAPPKGSVVGSYIGGVITSLVTAFVLDYFFTTFQITDMKAASGWAFLFWLGFLATSAFGSVLWEKKPLSLYFLNAGYSLVSLQLISFVLLSFK